MHDGSVRPSEEGLEFHLAREERLKIIHRRG
jgi:hypothetical protein